MRCLGFVCALKLSFCTVSYCLFGILYQNCLPVPLYYKKVVSATSNDINKEYFKNLISAIHFHCSKGENTAEVLHTYWHMLAMMCACPRATYVIRNGSFQNFIRILCLWTQLCEFLKPCDVMTAFPRCLTSKCSRKEPEAGEVCVPLSPGSALCSFGLWLPHGSHQCRAQQPAARASASSGWACLRWDLSPSLNTFSVLMLN